MQIYTREERGSPLRATRAVTTLKVRLASIVALLQDTKACAEWVVRCAESNELKRVSDSVSYIYSRTDMPWPVVDRDNIAHVRWSRSADSRTITMTTRAAPHFIPGREGVLRFNKSDSIWRLTQQADDTVRVEMLCHVELGGSLPAWLINQIVVDSPRQMLESMRRLLREGRYRDAVLAPMAAATANTHTGNSSPFE